MKMKIVDNTLLQVFVPPTMQAQAPAILNKIWREEFAGRAYFLLEMTDTVEAFVAEARLNRFILVYR